MKKKCGLVINKIRMVNIFGKRYAKTHKLVCRLLKTCLILCLRFGSHDHISRKTLVVVTTNHWLCTVFDLNLLNLSLQVLTKSICEVLCPNGSWKCCSHFANGKVSKEMQEYEGSYQWNYGKNIFR